MLSAAIYCRSRIGYPGLGNAGSGRPSSGAVEPGAVTSPGRRIIATVQNDYNGKGDIEMKLHYESPLMEVLLYDTADFLAQSGNDFWADDIFGDDYGDKFGA